MADNMKNIGVPINDDDLGGVAGGVVSPRDIEQEIIDRVKEELRELKPKNPVAVPQRLKKQIDE